jgi:hypothetical protein
VGARLADVRGNPNASTVPGTDERSMSAAWANRRSPSASSFGLTPLDPATFAAVSLIFAVVTALASYFPARRAMRVDPLFALRCE